MRIALAYKNLAANRRISHTGLGVTSMTNSKVRQKAGPQTEVWPVTNNIDIVNRIKKTINDDDAATHLVIRAPWLSNYDLSTMVHAFPQIKFAVVSHSNFGFLQVDPNGVPLLRQVGKVAYGTHNLYFGG